MNADGMDEMRDRDRDELLRLASQGRGRVLASPGLRARLARDAALRAEFEEVCELLGDLSAALRPGPLPETLLRRIQTRLDAAGQPRTHRALRGFRVAALAAAAALLLGVIGPLGMPPPSRQSSLAGTLSAAEAADIVAAYGLLAWSGQVDYSIERVVSGLAEVQQRIEGQEARRQLPWGPEDDWDAPPDANQGAVPGTRPPLRYVQVEARDFVRAASAHSGALANAGLEDAGSF